MVTMRDSAANARAIPEYLHAKRVASIAAACAGAGMMFGILPAMWLVVDPKPPIEAYFVGAYAIVAATSLAASMLFRLVREAQSSMRMARVTPQDITRGLILGTILSTALVACLWATTGFRGLYMIAPTAGVFVGAWLSARHVVPFGVDRTEVDARP